MASERVAEILRIYHKTKERVENLTDELLRKDDEISEAKYAMDNLIKARWVITETQRLTQERFKERVEKLVTMAIKSVFEDRRFAFELVFEEKRNQMEVRPVVTEMVGETKVYYEDIENQLGGSIVDIISIALRVVMWSLENPKSRALIISDEPLKNMGDLISLGGQIMQEIAHELGIQLIIITHDQELIDIADKAYHIKHSRGKSIVEEIRR